MLLICIWLPSAPLLTSREGDSIWHACLAGATQQRQQPASPQHLPSDSSSGQSADAHLPLNDTWLNEARPDQCAAAAAAAAPAPAAAVQPPQTDAAEEEEVPKKVAVLAVGCQMICQRICIRDIGHAIHAASHCRAEEVLAPCSCLDDLPCMFTVSAFCMRAGAGRHIGNVQHTSAARQRRLWPGAVARVTEVCKRKFDCFCRCNLAALWADRHCCVVGVPGSKNSARQSDN